MKLIFLDIDGVLNYQTFYKKENAQKDFKTMLEYDLSMIDNEKIKLLNELIKETSAKVVISSSWRKNKSIEYIRNIFKTKEFIGDIIDFTPVLYFTGLEDYHYSVPRGNEIKAWLEINKDKLQSKMSKIRYVIFDDDSDMLYWQRDKFIHVDNYIGLTPKNINRAKQILNY